MSAYDARTQLGEVLDQVRYTREPCIISRHGKPVAVIVDYASYEMGLRQNRQAELPKQYQDWLPTVVDKIVRGYKPERIILFGSVASGKVRAGSDVDLCIIKRTRKRRLDRVDEVTELLPPEIPAEVMVYTPEEWGQKYRDKDVMVREIHSTGKVLYDRKVKTGLKWWKRYLKD